VAGLLISLAAGLGSFGLAPQVALAAWQQPAASHLPPSAVTAGTVHSCAIENGRAYCWGDNSDGELGDRSTVNSSVPVAVYTRGVLAGKTLTQITASGGHVCALDSAGAAFCWGANNVGQLGNGATTGSAAPVAVRTSGVLAGHTLTQITSGNLDTCALDSAGAAYCWGWNADGQLGNASTADSSVPVAVKTSGVLAGQALTQISSGLRHACAVDVAGAAFCWGNNDSGQLGNAATTGSSVPVAVKTSGALAGKTVTQITAGEVHTCALDTTGAAVCWGDNAGGELGDGSTTTSAVPVAVDVTGALAGQTITQISAGQSYTCAVAAAGAAYCWGINTAGVLGDGNTTSSSVPIAVNSRGVLAGQHIIQVEAGGDHTCAVDADGALYCWGQNTFGDLGDGASTQSTVPVLTGPDAPANVTGVPASSSAAVTWDAPASLDGGTLTGYTATATPGSQACRTKGATTCTIRGLTGLTHGTIYQVAVVAHTTVGDSGASAPAVVLLKAEGGIISGHNITKCVDDTGGSAADGTAIVLEDCNGTPEQHWAIKADGTIQVNGKCMDIANQSSTNRALIDLFTCSGGSNQQWLPANGTLVNPVSGKCLDDPAFKSANGTQLEIFTCNGGANQQWILP
jgi:alpha-tubulin suppressor-like RCC1 family protein